MVGGICSGSYMCPVLCRGGSSGGERLCGGTVSSEHCDTASDRLPRISRSSRDCGSGDGREDVESGRFEPNRPGTQILLPADEPDGAGLSSIPRGSLTMNNGLSYSNTKVLPRGSCPACLKPIDRNKMEVSKEFPCPHCQRLVRTTTLFRVCMNVVSIGLATVVSFCSGWPLFGKIIAWPVSWFIFTCLYIWIASIVRLPRLILSRKREEHE